MQFGLFMMPLHPPERSFTESYDRDLAQIVVADRLGYHEVWIGAPQECADRIRQLVYIAAVMLENGQSVFSQLPKDVVEARTKAAQETSGGLEHSAAAARCLRHRRRGADAVRREPFQPASFNTFDAAQAREQGRQRRGGELDRLHRSDQHGL